MSNLRVFELSSARSKVAKTVFTTAIVIVLLASGSTSFAAGPVLYFSDITSGPNSGNTDGAGGLSRLQHGAIVTVWGKNLGSTQGDSRVYVNGAEAAHIYYWENADPETGDSGPADLYAYHLMQEIAFSVPANANDGKGAIYVVVDGVPSDSLEFTVRSGNIYFVKTTGSDSTGDGSWDNPWATVDRGGASSKMVAGDTVYACDGVVESGGLDIRYTQGTAENPISVIAYPAQIIYAVE